MFWSPARGIWIPSYMSSLTSGGLVGKSLSLVNAPTIRLATPSSGPPTPAGNVVVYLRGDTGLFTDTGGTTPVSSDGDQIACWTDQSVNGYKFIQATAGQRPLYKTVISGAAQCVQFTAASSQNLQISAGNVTLTGGIGSAYAVIRRSGANYETIMGPVGSTGAFVWRLSNTSVQQIVAQNSSVVATANTVVSDVTWTVLGYGNAGAGANNMVIRTNKAADLTGNGTTIPWNNQVIGLDTIGGGFGWNGQMLLYLVYDAGHNATQMQTVEAWIATEFGV